MSNREAPVPFDEASRLEAVRQSRLLDTGRETSFEDMIDITQDRFRTPMAAISLIDEARQWFKASRGLDVCETSRDVSFCAHTILTAQSLAIDDARLDERFRDNPQVTGHPFVRAYLGAPLITREGLRIGAICAVDTEARSWSDADKAFIERCARLSSRFIQNRIALYSSDRKHFLELAQNRYEARYRTMVARMIEGVIVQGENGAIIDSNPSAARILGLTEDELFGRTSRDPRWRAVAEDGTELSSESHPAMVALRTGEAQSNFVMGVHRPDGSLRWIIVNSQCIEIENAGALRQVVSTFADITDQRARETELTDAVNRAQNAERAKSHFIDAMSHEVRTPLNGMLGATQSLLARNPDELSESVRKKVELFHRSSLSLKAIVDDALDINRVAHDRLELATSTYSLLEAVHDAVSLHEPVAITKGLAFAHAVDIAPDVFVLGDAGRLKQVINNLLSNAVKFTRQGSVKITGRVEHKFAGPELVLCVSDTGIGVPPEFAPKLGTSFARADNSVVAGIGGAGLGLSLSRAIAEKMGGSLVYEPNPGGGSIFLFRKPLHLGDKPTLEEAAVATEGDLAPLKLLVAEDHPANREIISVLLEPFDLELQFAADGLEALEVATRMRFDLVLMDLKMPRMDGLEATERLRAWEFQTSAKRTPIICISASSEGAVLQSIMDAGADGFLAKPIDMNELIRCLQAVAPPRTPISED